MSKKRGLISKQSNCAFPLTLLFLIFRVCSLSSATGWCEDALQKDKTVVLESSQAGTVQTSLYDEALKAYQKGDFSKAITTLRLALDSGSKSVGMLTLLGWSYYKSSQYESAEQSFSQALEIDARVDDATIGLAYVNLDNGHPQVALSLFLKLVLHNPDNPEIQCGLAAAYLQQGDNIAAAKVYRTMIEKGMETTVAKEKLLALYGYPEYGINQRLEPAPLSQPKILTINFRTHGDYFEVQEDKHWKRTYIKGVNIGPARPGEFPSTPPLHTNVYLEWLNQIAEMNANTIRVYTILPPAFYQALKIHNERSARKLWLLQEVWLAERDDICDLYSESWTDDFKSEIKMIIDLIHGQANIPFRRGHAFGVYTADVSPYVFGIGIGRELEPSVVLCTNAAHPSKTQYQGHFISIAEGNPSEVWFAEMCDQTITYEMDKYKTQRPITVINWPPLDPIYHIAEANYTEELQIRRSLGEDVREVITKAVNDMDAVALDVRKYIAHQSFPAGIFAAFHVYSYWPDFLIYDPVYPQTKDEEGTNRYLGYLIDLKKYHPNIPLLIAEYGIPTSWGIAHIHPEGWGNGGFSEKRQAELLVRMTKNIKNSECAGGLVFEWQDEWWKRVTDDFTRPFSKLSDRKPLWLNPLDPEEFFGILGYRSSMPIPLLRGDPNDWEKATSLIAVKSSHKLQAGSLKQIYAFSDSAFFYVRLDVERGKGNENIFDWNNSHYWIAVNTLPGKAGSKTLPELSLDLTGGANFLIALTGIDSSKIYISQNYNPNTWIYNSPVPEGRRWRRKMNMLALLEFALPFEELMIETNRIRYGRNGSVFPSLSMSRSPLQYGSADPASSEYSNLSSWHVDREKGMIEVRIPWGLLYFMDPSSRLVLSGTDGRGDPVPRETDGISIVAMHMRNYQGQEKVRKEIHDSLPSSIEGKITQDLVPIYTWQKWNQVKYDPYLKESYTALKKVFGEMELP